MGALVVQSCTYPLHFFLRTLDLLFLHLSDVYFARFTDDRRAIKALGYCSRWSFAAVAECPPSNSRSPTGDTDDSFRVFRVLEIISRYEY